MSAAKKTRLPVGVQLTMVWLGMTALTTARDTVRAGAAGNVILALLLGGSALLGAMFVVGAVARQPWSWSVGIASLFVGMVWEVVALLAGDYTYAVALFIRLAIEFLATVVLLRPSSRAALGADG